ncbi:MAG: glycosyltransferase family 2 protein [Chloroflexi bacterium]|nr:glycosyltransferase family 2 protein [Chloroflexota bacterium]
MSTPFDSLPLVTIVTPSFNQAQFLGETIESVLSQDYPRIEYIILDGGSTDGSVDIIRRYEDRLAAWVSEPDKGQTEAINRGFGMAHGEILAWLNSDDVYRAGAVKEAVAHLQAHPEVGMVHGGGYYIDEAGAAVARFPSADTNHRELRRGAPHIAQQSAFFRSAVWRMVGPLDPTFYYAMDYDLWIRISAMTPLAYVPRMWSGFRLHGESKSMTVARRCWPEMIRVHFRDGGSVFSILYAKYLVRRVVEPVMPLRMGLRRMRFRLDPRHPAAGRPEGEG